MAPVDLGRFADPWEHLRLLSDGARTEALVELLARRAPGRRVVEVGCGTGLLSCVAARLGATRVIALEPTAIAQAAREMVAANGLEGVVEVVQARVQDLAPEPVDLAFSELLNADPFVEGVLEAMAAVRPWVVPGGWWAPRRLRIWAAAVREASSAREARMARREVGRLAGRFDLDLGALDALLADPGPVSMVCHVGELATEPALLWDLEVGADPLPAGPRRVELPVREPGPVGGVAVWFEAELDEGLVHHNRPGRGGHWGQLLCAWPVEVGLGLGGRLEVVAEVGPEGVRVAPAGFSSSR